MKSIPPKVKQSGTSFAVYRRQQRIEKVRTLTNGVLDAIAGIYEDDFENTASHLDKFLEKLEFESIQNVALFFRVTRQALLEQIDREDPKSLEKNPKSL